MSDEKSSNSLGVCQEIWAINKYFVLSKSHKLYLEIREYLKHEGDSNFLMIKIETAKDLKESKKDFINACLHIWGYFKKEASKEEKDRFFSLIEEYKASAISSKDLKIFLKSLLDLYPNSYLEKSNFFNI